MITKIVLNDGEFYFVGQQWDNGGKVAVIAEDFVSVPLARVFNVEFENDDWIEIQGHAVKAVYYKSTRNMK